MKTFNSKLLLFGEYSVLNGSKALATPYKNYSGQLKLGEYATNKASLHSHNVMVKLFDHLQNIKTNAIFNVKKIEQHLNQGLHFDSNIPFGYGLGSSGALVAAIYHEYFENKPTPLPHIKADLAKLESFFHGNSSGTDPLVSYTNKALLLNPDQAIDNIEPNEDIVCFLIDSQQTRETARLMNLYSEKTKQNPTLVEEIKNQTNITIDAFINQSPFSYTEIQHLCILQNHFMADFMVLPKALQNHKLLFGEMLSIKLCGAGGGGFALGFTRKTYWEEVKNKLNELEVYTMPIYL